MIPPTVLPLTVFWFKQPLILPFWMRADIPPPIPATEMMPIFVQLDGPLR